MIRLASKHVDKYYTSLCFLGCFRHVQVNNDSAIKFYERFGFEIVERKANYYKRIEPADAFVLQKTFRQSTESGISNGMASDSEIKEEMS